MLGCCPLCAPCTLQAPQNILLVEQNPHTHPSDPAPCSISLASRHRNPCQASNLPHVFLHAHRSRSRQIRGPRRPPHYHAHIRATGTTARPHSPLHTLLSEPAETSCPENNLGTRTGHGRGTPSPEHLSSALGARGTCPPSACSAQAGSRLGGLLLAEELLRVGLGHGLRHLRC